MLQYTLEKPQAQQSDFSCTAHGNKSALATGRIRPAGREFSVCLRVCVSPCVHACQLIWEYTLGKVPLMLSERVGGFGSRYSRHAVI